MLHNPYYVVIVVLMNTTDPKEIRMETIIKEIPVTEIQVGDEVFGSSGGVSTTDKGYWITVTDCGTMPSPHYAKVSYEINGETYSKDYPIDGFVFVKRQG